MISIWLQSVGTTWFGVASHEDGLVATVVGRSRDKAERSLLGCLPQDAETERSEDGSPSARKTVAMLARLEMGDEEGKCFDLSPTYVPQTLSAVLRTAAAIPRGYVASYGDIASISSTDARTVGKVMARNPLYPIVPCHRVVGTDLSLVGYGGSQRPPALRSKLARLRAEARGYVCKRAIETAGGLTVSPVEWAIAKAVRDGVADGPQLSLW